MKKFDFIVWKNASSVKQFLNFFIHVIFFITFYVFVILISNSLN